MLQPPEPTVVYRDAHLLVAHKPSGLPVQQTREASPRTLESWVREQPGVEYVALHHRLDAQAQGLVAVAISRAANKGLAAAFRDRTAVRRYRALVHGRLVDDDGEWKHRESRRGDRREAEDWDEGGSGRPMRSSWRVLERRGPKTLLEVRLQTGRTHQIRLQCEAEGHPVVGDRVYGFGERTGMKLQAFSLELAHPVTGEMLSWELPEPDGWGRRPTKLGTSAP